MALILGLDLGTSSIGYSLIDDQKMDIVDMGVRIFPEGVDNLGDGQREQSKNAQRTANRSKRRQFYRRRLRKQYLLKLLAQYKMCPLPYEVIRAWNLKDLSNDLLFRDWIKQDPYELRSKAGNEQLTLHEIGRVFFHMIQRRGFQSNSRNASSDEGKIFDGDNKAGKIGINETAEAKGDQTLGEYLYNIKPLENEPNSGGLPRIRNRYTTRSMYIEEFEKIWECQSQYHEMLDNGLKALLGGRKREEGYSEDGVLFHQRPLRSQKHLVGNCTLEPKKTKCLKSHPVFEEFNIYQWVNTVDCNVPLTTEDREKIVDILVSKKSITFGALRKVIGREDNYYQFNFENKETIKKAHTIPDLSNKKYFGKGWFVFTPKEKDDIWHVLHFFDDKVKLRHYAMEKWGFDENKASAISCFNLNDNYANLSKKAMTLILPYLKVGYTYSDAVVLAGVQNAFGESWSDISEEKRDFIIDNVGEIISSKRKGGSIEPLKAFLKSEFSLTDRQLKKLYHHSANTTKIERVKKLPVNRSADRKIQAYRNPVLITAIFELRKVINELIELHGQPDKVHVELARDLKASKSKRNDIKRQQSERERQNDRIRQEVNNLGQDVRSRTNLLKYKLWEECNRTCPYTGNSISVEQLYSEQVEIEHIHPLSQSLNDSIANKTLCFTAENGRKENRTPYEYYFKTFGEEKWEAVKSQALSSFKNKENYADAYHKFKHFIKQERDNDFTTRHLNDTRYLSRVAKDYLAQICDKVVTLPGQMTAIIRKMWELNRILNPDDIKEREDHRHHAVDALTIACMTKSHLQQLSANAEYDDSFRFIHDFPKPWANFRVDAERAVDNILITYKQKNDVLNVKTTTVLKNGKTYTNTGIAARGELHKETVYGYRQAPASEQSLHVRRSLGQIQTEKQVAKIVDSTIRILVSERIKSLGGYIKEKVPEGAFFKASESGELIPQVFLPNKNGDKVPIKKVRMRETVGNAVKLKSANQWVNPGNNHHFIVYQDGHGELKYEAVPFWVAVERKLRKEALYQLLPAHRKEGKMIEIFRANDLFILGQTEEEIADRMNDSLFLQEHLYKVQKIAGGDYFFEICFRKHTDSRLDKDAKPQYKYIKNFGTGKTGWYTHQPYKVNLSVTGKLSMK